LLRNDGGTIRSASLLPKTNLPAPARLDIFAL
jgi:hypothetical protein